MRKIGNIAIIANFVFPNFYSFPVNLRHNVSKCEVRWQWVQEAYI